MQQIKLMITITVQSSSHCRCKYVLYDVSTGQERNNHALLTIMFLVFPAVLLRFVNIFNNSRREDILTEVYAQLTIAIVVLLTLLGYLLLQLIRKQRCKESLSFFLLVLFGLTGKNDYSRQRNRYRDSTCNTEDVDDTILRSGFRYKQSTSKLPLQEKSECGTLIMCHHNNIDAPL